MWKTGTPQAVCERSRFTLSGPPSGAPLIPIRSKPIVVASIACFSAAAFSMGFGAVVQWTDWFRMPGAYWRSSGALAGACGGLLFGFLGVAAIYKGESAWTAGGRLFHSFRLWPFRYVLEYDLAKIHKVRAAVPPGTAQDHTVYFEYGGAEIKLGTNMPRRDAESTMWAIIGAADKARATPTTAPGPASFARPDPNLKSALALVVANFVSLAGVILFDWKLEELIFLFWAESGVIAVYHLFKMAKLGGPQVLVFGPLFLAQFGTFMAMHFYLIYEILPQVGVGRKSPSVAAALASLAPLWPAILSYFISHGFSFWTNFLKRREHLGRDLKSYMGEPWRRILVMHFAIIGGFWVVAAMGSGTGFLLALVLLKIGFDLVAHLRERARASLPQHASAPNAPAAARAS